jgi:GNAT superfamily N-acetyltransferase
MKIKIVEATESDLSAVVDLYAQSDIYDGQVIPREKAEAIFAKMKSYPDYKVYVSVVDDEIVGAFALLILENLAHFGKPSGIIEGLVVNIANRGQGIGKKMVLFAMDYCRNAGCYKLSISSNVKREDVHTFYESLGFRKNGFSFVVEI